MTDAKSSLPAPQDRTEPTPPLTPDDIDQIVEGIREFICYGDPFVDELWEYYCAKLLALKASLPEVAAPARAHQEERTPVRDMGEATEDGDRICEWCNQQVPRRHRCVAGPNPCSVCGTYLWGDTRPCWNCARQNAGDLARSATRERGDPHPAAAPDAGEQQDRAETTKRSVWHMRNVLRDPHTFKHRFEDEAMEIVKAIKRDYAPDLDSNDGGEILGWILQVCDQVAVSVAAQKDEEYNVEMRRTLEDFQQARRDFQNESRIVDNVWGALGISTYEGANGKHIAELVRELHAEVLALREKLADPAHQERTEPTLAHAARSLANSLPDVALEALRAEWGNSNVAVVKHWRDETLKRLEGAPARAAEWQPLTKELLAALKSVTEHMDRAGGDAYAMPECPWCQSQREDNEHDADCELLRARAVIAKVETLLPPCALTGTKEK